MLDASGQEKYRYLQTDAIQKLDNAEAVRKHFEYIDRWGEVRSPIDESFSKLKLGAQKEVAEGIEWARQSFELDALPSRIQTASLGKGVFGEYREGSRALSFWKSLKVDDAFSTAVHEMAHYADHVMGYPSTEICAQARKNLGLRRTKRAYTNQAISIAGKYHKIDAELFAYSLEMYATKRGNALSNEIAKLWLERVKKA